MKIMKKIDSNFKNGEIVDKMEKAADNPNAIKNYGVESMTLDRGNCFLCKEKFDIGEVIVMRIVFDSRTASQYGRDVKWNHVECFADRRESFRYRLSGRFLPGFRQLDEDDQQLVKYLLP